MFTLPPTYGIPSQVKLTRKVTGDEWMRFREHAKHVRILTHFGSSSPDGLFQSSNENLMLSLRGAFPEGNALPALRELYWVARSSDEVDGMCYFVSPTTRKLAMQLAPLSYTTCLSEIIKTISAIASPLTHIQLHRDSLRDDGAKAVAQFLDAILQLCPRVVYLAIDSDVFQVMLSNGIPLLPNLVSMMIESLEYAQSDLLPVLVYNPFPSLQEIHGEELTLWNYLLPTIGTNLQRLTITMSGHLYVRTSRDAFVQMFRHISRSCPRLVSLELSAIDFEIQDRDSLVGVLRPLLACTHLTELIVETVGEIAILEEAVDLCSALSDDDVDEMALAWPQLQVLTIRNSLLQHESFIETQLTQRALASLFDHCPSLRSLTLTVGFQHLHESHAPHPARMLERVNFANSAVDDPAALAKWLENVCRADAVHWTKWQPYDSYTREDRWDDMITALKQLQGDTVTEKTDEFRRESSEYDENELGNVGLYLGLKPGWRR
jgi:hypothetical protein